MPTGKLHHNQTQRIFNSKFIKFIKFTKKSKEFKRKKDLRFLSSHHHQPEICSFRRFHAFVKAKKNHLDPFSIEFTTNFVRTRNIPQSSTHFCFIELVLNYFSMDFGFELIFNLPQISDTSRYFGKNLSFGDIEFLGLLVEQVKIFEVDPWFLGFFLNIFITKNLYVLIGFIYFIMKMWTFPFSCISLGNSWVNLGLFTLFLSRQIASRVSSAQKW